MLSSRRLTEYGLLLFVLAMLLAGCGQGDAISRTPTGESVEGWTVVPLESEQIELAQILSVNKWKFELRHEVEGETGLRLSLALVAPDGANQTLNDMRIISDRDELESLVAVYPIDESIHRAEQIRIYMKSGSGSNSIVIANPFRDFSASYTAGAPESLGEGAYRLMAFADDEPMPSAENYQLVVQVEGFQPENW